VLALIGNACLAVTIVDWNRRRGPWYVRFSWRYSGLALLFVGMTLAVVIARPEGLIVAAACMLAGGVLWLFSRRVGKPALRQA
jgi:hypothetical protein